MDAPPPDGSPLDLDALRAALADRWARVDVVAETPSTNADLLARGSAAADRTLLSAEFQNAGRGRFDRVWTSPPGVGLTTSFLFRPRAPLARWGWLPLLAGVAVVEAVRQVTGAVGAAAALKWPNDVLLADRKVAGILVQSADGAVVIGIGMNVANTADELPPGVAATSLALAGAQVDRTELLIALASGLDARVAQWDDCGGDAAACGLAAAYRDVCDTVGREVTVSLAHDTDATAGTDGGGSVTGTAREVDDSGHLVVHAGEQRHVVTAGDVVHLRPAAGNR